MHTYIYNTIIMLSFFLNLVYPANILIIVSCLLGVLKFRVNGLAWLYVFVRFEALIEEAIEVKNVLPAACTIVHGCVKTISNNCKQ